MFTDPRALRRLLWAPNQLGLARAYVAGELDVEGDVRPDRRQLPAEQRLLAAPHQILPPLGTAHLAGIVLMHCICLEQARALADVIRPESREAVQRLHEMDIEVAMLTGDSQAVADAVARRLRIDDVAAQVLPEDKADAVARFQQGGQRVAMVGDGVNDAPALAQADVGVAIGTGTDVAIETGDVILMSGDLRGIVNAIALSRRTLRTIRNNFIWAYAYNVALIPVAAGRCLSSAASRGSSRRKAMAR
mgnify:CR=1 FL=1